MKDDLYIDSLASDLQKSRVPYAPGRSLLLMVFISLVCAAVMLAIWGFRADIGQAWDRPGFQLELILLLGLSLVAYVMAERSSVPGLLRHPARGFIGLLMLLFLAVGMVVQHPHSEILPNFMEGWHCLALIAANGMLPMFFALRLIKNGASTHPRLTMTLALLGSFGAAVGIQHLICPMESSWHLILWHLGILPAAMIMSWALGRRVLGW